MNSIPLPAKSESRILTAMKSRVREFPRRVHAISAERKRRKSAKTRGWVITVDLSEFEGII